jgi:hypothetical protein
MQTQTPPPPSLKTALFLATVIAFAIISASCGGGGAAASVPAVADPPAVNLSPVSLGFGSQPLAKCSSGQTVTLSNSGNAALNIASSAVTGTNAGDFAQTNNCGASVAAGANCTISVTFMPTAAGARAATLSITDNAPGSPHTVALSGTGEASGPAVSLAPAGLTFPLQAVGTTSGAETVTLTNTGGAALSVTSLAVTGANASDFAETNSCGNSVAAGANCTLSVTFTPSASGARAAALSLADNASGSPQTVSLSGTGASTAAGVGLSPASLAFANQAVSTTSAAQAVTLTNTGNASLSVTSLALTGANAGDFAETNTCGTSVAAGAKCTISVTFTPSASGARAAALSLADNASGSPQTVSLSGTGTSTAAGVGLSPASLAFASQSVGTTSTAQTVTLTNTGNAGLSVTSLALTGANAGDFAQTNTCGSSVPAGANCTISVTFKPSASGARTAAISIADNASGSPQTVGLSGTGASTAAAGVSLSPASLAFASQSVGTSSSTQAVTLTNTGNAGLSVTSLAVTGANASDFTQANTCGSSVGAGANCKITVMFTPAASGARTAALSIADNATGSPQTVGLSGTGASAAAGVSLSPASLTFASQSVGTTSAVGTVTLTNTGNSSLSVTSLALTGANAGDFAQTNTCGSSVAAGANCTLSVTFSPSASGARAAALSIADNASGSPQTVGLSGTGTAPPPSGIVISGISVTTGPTAGGTSLILTGSGFQAGATVSFGSTPAASVSVFSSTQIQATTPPLSAGTVSVTVTNPGGGRGTLPDGFTFDDSSFWQFLDQFYTGVARDATKPYSLLERTSTCFIENPCGIYQPDMVIFHETTTGVEIWRLDNDPSSTWTPGILNRTPWSSNGAWMLLGSNRCIPEVYECGQAGYIYDGRGGLQRLQIPYDPTRTPSWTEKQGMWGANGGYQPWDRLVNPNLLYVTTWDDTNYGNWSTPQSSLYSIDVSNNDKMTFIVSLPNPTIKKTIQSYLSEDNVVMARDVNPNCVATPTESVPNQFANVCTSPQVLDYIPDIYMVDMNSSRTSTYKTIIGQYPIDFGLTATGHSQANEYHFHDIYFRRKSTDTFIFNYGPLGSVGESVWWEAPLNGVGANVQLAFANSTYSTPYYSHPAWNFTGLLVAYEGEEVLGDNNYESWVRNHDLHQTLAQIGGVYAGHYAWDGYDPNYVAFDENVVSPSMVALMESNPNGSAQRPLVIYQAPSNPNDVGNLYGPTQSPDATKVSFVTNDNWLSSTSEQHTYVVVSHPPFPPVLAVSSTSPVTLSWTPYQTAREVAGYHVYRSPNGTTSFVEITTSMATGTTYTDSTATSGNTYYYAVTAQENSGIESNQLSNIMQVIVGGSGSQFAAQGLQGWDTASPAPPTGVGLTSLATNVWKLTWTASASSDVRYYNVFYGDGSEPPPTQPFLVDSPPVYETSYIYWQADPNSTPFFGIQAVDRQGNQSSMVCVAGTSPPGPCS